MDDPGSKSLFYQNIELRRRLDEEHNNYKRKLQVLKPPLSRNFLDILMLTHVKHKYWKAV